LEATDASSLGILSELVLPSGFSGGSVIVSSLDEESAALSDGASLSDGGDEDDSCIASSSEPECFGSNGSEVVLSILDVSCFCGISSSVDSGGHTGGVTDNGTSFVSSTAADASCVSDC